LIVLSFGRASYDIIKLPLREHRTLPTDVQIPPPLTAVGVIEREVRAVMT